MDPFHLTPSGDKTPETKLSSQASSSSALWTRIKSSRITRTSLMFTGVALLAMVSLLSFSSTRSQLLAFLPMESKAADAKKESAAEKAVVKNVASAAFKTVEAPAMLPPVTLVYDAAGNYTFTVPDGVTSVTVQVWGAGGGGAQESPNSSDGGGGGGGGGYRGGVFTVTPSSNMSIIVGAGGAGGTNGSRNGGNGGNSSVTQGGNAVTAFGGVGGRSANGGGNGGNGGAGSFSGTIGSQVAFNGGNGRAGDGDEGGGGGGSAGALGNGGNGGGNGAANQNHIAGTAGNGGGGAGGQGGNDGSGSAGNAPGGGGGGAGDDGGGGGAGAPGKVIITFNCDGPCEDDICAATNAANPQFCSVCNTCSYTVLPNPDLVASCADMRIVLVLDESLSISQSNATSQVRNGVLAFVNALACTGVQLNVVEFNSSARYVISGYNYVDNALVTAIQNYFDNVNNPLLVDNADYTPANYTNWQAAFMAVDALAESPNLIVFFTDGVPTMTYLNADPPENAYQNSGQQCGGTGAPEPAEIGNAVKMANKLKCEGAKIFAFGVGTVDAPNLQAISGPDQFPTNPSIVTADYALPGSFEDLAESLVTFVGSLCPFDSDVTSQNICPGGTNGSVTISIPSELTPYSYVLYNDNNNSVVDSENGVNDSPLVIGNLAVGSYRIELSITVSPGCVRVETIYFDIEAGAEEIVLDSVVGSPVECGVENSGSVLVTVDTGVAPYSYSIYDAGDNLVKSGMGINMNPFTVTGLAAGMYTIQVADVNNCNTDTEPFTVGSAEGCCPSWCIVYGGPDDAVCPGVVSVFNNELEGVACSNPTTQWEVINSGGATAFIVGADDGTSVMVNSGNTCGSYTVSCTITCEGCVPTVCVSDEVVVADGDDPIFEECPTEPIDLGCNPTSLPDDETIIADAGTVTDNCGLFDVEVLPGDIVADGCDRSMTRAVVATDSCGNSAICLVTYTWTVITAPEIVGVPDDIDLGCNPTTFPVCATSVSASNECGPVMVSCEPGAVIEDGCMRTQMFIYAASGCELTSYDTTIYTWMMVSPPEFVEWPADTTLTCDEIGDFDLESTEGVVAEDNCGGEVTIGVDLDTIPGDSPYNYTIIRTFTVTGTCDIESSETVQQVIEVIENNLPPVANDDAASTVSGVEVVIEVLNNDMDDSGLDISTVTIIDGPFNGMAVVNVDGTISYTSNVDFVGTDSLYYVVCDDGVACQVLCDTAKVVITLSERTLEVEAEPMCIMDAPWLVYGVVDPNFDTTGLTATIYWLNPENDDVIAVYDNMPLQGSVLWPGAAVDMNGNGIAWPGWAYDNVNNVWVEVEDGYHLLRPTAKVIISVNPSDTLFVDYPLSNPFCFTDPPGIVTTPDSAEICINAMVEVNVLVNDSAVLGGVLDPSTLEIFTQGQNGTAEVVADSIIKYTPNDGFQGMDTVVYRICTDNMEMPVCGHNLLIITVLDTLAPEFTFVPEDLTVACDEEIEFDDATATDNCAMDIVPTEERDTIPGDCAGNYVIVRVFTALDDAGLMVQDTQYITVVDTVAPEILACPVARTISGCGLQDITNPPYSSTTTVSSYAQFSNQDNQGSAEDNCSGLIVSYKDTVLSTSCPIIVLRTWTIADECGNAESCNQSITIVDNEPPTFTCPENLVLQCDEAGDLTIEGNPAIAAWIEEFVSSLDDNCEIDTFYTTYDPAFFTNECGITGNQWVFFSVTDACGNSTGCSAQVIISDEQGPVCMARDTVFIQEVVDPETGVVTLSIDSIDAGSFGVCSGISSMWIEPAELSCENEGPNVVTLFVLDSCENLSVCTTIVVLDCVDPCVKINTFVYLDGATSDPAGGSSHSIPMRTNLNNTRVLPGQCFVEPFSGTFFGTPVGQPYSIAPWFYNGDEGCYFDSGNNPAMGAANYPPTVTDWVLVSLRTNIFSESTVFQAAALLHNDGRVEFVDKPEYTSGSCEITYPELCDLDLFAPYYVVIEHRNHLIVMSHEPVYVDLDNSTLTYDFRNKQSFYDPDFPFEPGGETFIQQLQILPGVYSMYGGNGEQSSSFDADTDININDRTSWELDNGQQAQYRIGDYNMNVDVNFNDRVIVERNNGKITTVPRD